jgi:hypothetical protein
MLLRIVTCKRFYCTIIKAVAQRSSIGVARHYMSRVLYCISATALRTAAHSALHAAVVPPSALRQTCTAELFSLQQLLRDVCQIRVLQRNFQLLVRSSCTSTHYCTVCMPPLL